MTFEELIKVATQAVGEENFSSAIKNFTLALESEPNNKKIFYNLGVCYLKNKQYHKAIEYFKEALLLDSNYLSANTNIAIAYKKISQYSKALHHLFIAHNNKNDDMDILHNLANTLSSIEEYDSALKFYNKILKISPSHHKAYYGIGIVYNLLMQYDKAYAYFKHALKLKPEFADAIFAISLIQLRNKNYKSGWYNYEARWEASNPLDKLSYKVPFYNGEDLTNKIILIQEEQGFGDNIQFIRYLDKIKEKKPKKIYLALRNPLKRVFEKINGVNVVSDSDIIHNVDYIVSLLSLPRIFETEFETIPNMVPYLPQIKFPLDKDVKKLFDTKKLKVAFAFSGNSDHKNNHYRSIALEIFETLFENSAINFYSLQISEKPKNMDDIFKKYSNVIDLSLHISDFYDTANMFHHFDYVISIDSALAHFSGAYNIPTILLLPQNAEWRWFDNLDYSPWYPSIKIYRQKNLGIWREVINNCASFLKEEAKLLAD